MSEYRNDPSPVGDESVPGAVPTLDAKDAKLTAADESRGRGEGVGQHKDVQGLSQNQIVRRRFFRHKGALLGLVVIGLVLLLSFTSMGIGPIPGWWKYHNHRQTSPIADGGRPSWNHPFGQDNIGLDNFALVMKGVQTSVLVVLMIVVISGIIGLTVGALAGFFRGWVDAVLMRVTDTFITLPVLVLGSVLGTMLGTMPGKFGLSPMATQRLNDVMPLLLGLLLGLLLWTSLARLTRSEFLRLRELEFVDSARVAGASNWRIITKHILPNAIGVIIVNLTLMAAGAFVLEAGLSFLGFGIKDPQVSLGTLISTYQAAFSSRPWLFWWPGLFIVLLALSMNLIGDGLRDAFDPKTKRIPSVREMNKSAKLDAADAGVAVDAVDAPPTPGMTAEGEL